MTISLKVSEEVSVSVGLGKYFSFLSFLNITPSNTLIQHSHSTYRVLDWVVSTNGVSQGASILIWNEAERLGKGIVETGRFGPIEEDEDGDITPTIIPPNPKSILLAMIVKSLCPSFAISFLKKKKKRFSLLNMNEEGDPQNILLSLSPTAKITFCWMMY